MNLSLTYSDIAVGADGAFIPTATGATSYSDPSLLTSADTKTAANPCELYSVLLDSSLCIAANDEQYALVSSAVSDTSGDLPTGVVLTLTASGQYTSQGITIIFDELSGRYASSLNIAWYRGATQLATKDFAPDSPNYFCVNKVENYDKLVITFTSVNMPENRLYVNGILFGTIRRFGRDELENFSLLQELDPVSETIAISTVGFTLKKKSDIDFIFQEKQPVSVYFDDKLVQTSFITHYERNSDRSYDIESEDWISILDDSPCNGGMFTAKNANALISEIMTPLGVDYELDSALQSATITGYIPICSCREALNQIAFALGAAVSTSYSDKVRIFELDETLAGTLNDINTFTGQSTSFRDKLTELRLIAYSYGESTDGYTAYKAEESGTGNGIVVTFPEPLHTLSITNGTIISFNANQAVINASANCVLSGKKYDKTQTVITKRNPLILANDKENVIELNDFTLVNRTNADAIATAAYNYYSAGREISERILAGSFKVGDKVTQEYDYMDDVTGRITSMKFNLSGNAKVAEVVIQ